MGEAKSWASIQSRMANMVSEYSYPSGYWPFLFPEEYMRGGEKEMRKILTLFVLSLLLVAVGAWNPPELRSVSGYNPSGPSATRAENVQGDPNSIVPIWGCTSGPSCTCSDPIRGIECGRGRDVCVAWGCSWIVITGE